MRGTGAWALSLGGAGLFHAGMAWALLVSVAPEERQPPTARPESRLDLAVVSVPEARAEEVPSDGEAAPVAAPDGAMVASGAVAAVRARPLAPASQALAALASPPASPAETPDAVDAAPVSPVAEAAAPLRPASEAAAGLQPPAGLAVAPTAPEARIAAAFVPEVVTLQEQTSGQAQSVLAAIPAGTAPPDLAPTSEVAHALAPDADRAVPAAPQPSEVLARTTPGEAVRVRAPDAEVVSSAAIEMPSLFPAALPATAAPGSPSPAEILPSRVFRGPAAPAISPSSESVTAALAFSADLAQVLSEGAIDAVEAFLVPDPGADGQALRDGIAQRLGGVACARVQTAFDPETGALEIRGHVPGPGDRARLATAIEAELRGALPVVDRLLELPRPQCEVLSRLAAAGIPQSTEQFTNPLIIGEDAHARVYSFRGGDTMRLDIGGADYDGWLYLDYYDSAGDVLHLTPNAAVPPTLLPARAAARFGGGGDTDVAEGRVRLQVGPPFGKDIAVALVASAQLFDDLRPTQEPAATYLAALAQRVEELRGSDPQFKVEWVYLFVSTEP